MRRNNNNKQKSARGNKRNPRLLSPSSPPQVNLPQLTHSVRLRFTVTAAAVQTAITFTNLLETIIFAATATVPYRVFQAVKIRRVQAWAVPVIGGVSTIQLEFSGVTAGLVGDQAIHTDTSMGVQPAHVSAKPSARSLAADFQVASAANAFVLSCPAGTVVDLELSFRGQFNVGDACANAGAAMTAGATYLRGMDGLALAATNFPPAITAAFSA